MKVPKIVSAIALTGAFVLSPTPANTQEVPRVVFEAFRQAFEMRADGRRGPSIEEAYQQGRNYIGWGQLDNAEARVEQIREIEYRHGIRTDYDERLLEEIASARHNKGKSFIGWGQLDNAETEARRTRELEVRHRTRTDHDEQLVDEIASAQYAKGKSFIGWGQLDNAETRVREIRRLEKEFDIHTPYDTKLIFDLIDAHHQKGKSFIGWGQLDNAETRLDSILELERRALRARGWERADGIPHSGERDAYGPSHDGEGDERERYDTDGYDDRSRNDGRSRVSEEFFGELVDAHYVKGTSFINWNQLDNARQSRDRISTLEQKYGIYTERDDQLHYDIRAAERSRRR